MTYFPPVEVVDDGEVEALFPLPLALHGVAQELPQGPLSPLQQLVVQQQGVGSLWAHAPTANTTGLSITDTAIMFDRHGRGG